MNYCISLFSKKYLSILLDSPAQEIILHTKKLSRNGEIDDDELPKIITQIYQVKKNVILLFDIQCLDDDFFKIRNFLKGLPLHQIKAIRFYNFGVGLFLQEEFPDLKLHLITDSRILNIEALKVCENLFKPQLSRIILSNLIPLSNLKNFQSSIPLEIIGLGKIELFYSTRLLLNRYFSYQKEDYSLKIQAISHDRPNQKLLAVENQHGTFVYYHRDLFLLDCLNKLQLTPIQYLTLNFYQDQHYLLYQKALQQKSWQKFLQDSWPQKITHGFLNANKTDASFKRLSNFFLKKTKENVIGYVLDVVKPFHLIIFINQTIQIPCEIEYLIPDSRKITSTLIHLKDLILNDVTQIQTGYFIIPWVKSILPGSIICKID